MKKGFTLIELLAVIVIVAIITLIATPIISNVVNNSKVGALKSSAYGLLEASNLYYAQNGSKGIRFDINDNVISSNDTTKLLNYKGSIKRGTIIIDKKGNTTICITDGTNSAYKNYNDNDITTVTKETCNILSSSSIVYLENSGATRSELNNQELTDLVSTLQDEISTLKNNMNNKADKTELETVSTLTNTALNRVYPVGSIYMSMTDDTKEKVEEKLGGTWEQIESGRMLQSTSSDSGTKGGQSSVSYTPSGSVGNHTLTVSEIPSHSHDAHVRSVDSYSLGKTNPVANYGVSFVTFDVTYYSSGGVGSTNQCTFAGIQSTGGSGSHNHPFTGTSSTIATMPPYITVYMYKRIS